MCNEFSPNNYAHLDNDGAMIQTAVDEAAKSGGKVTVPRMNVRTGSCVWNIDRAIRLHTGSVICLDNCILRQSDGMFDNMFVNSNLDTDECYTREGRQSDIKIYGLGNAVLDGGVHNGKTEFTQKGEDVRSVLYNSMFNFVNTERITIENLRIINQRYWAVVFHYSAHCRISNIDFYATATAPNQDGIDLRTGCNHFTIENITGCTGDDTVALTCLKSRFDERIAQAQLDDAIHHVTIRNVCTTTHCSAVRLLNHRGKKLHNILVENIIHSAQRDEAQERGKDNPPLDEKTAKMRPGALVRIGENFYYGNGEKARLEDTYNITVRNVTGSMRMGIKANCALNNALFDNIQIYGDGGTAVYFGEGNMKNIKVSNIGYSLVHSPKPNDDNRAEAHYNMSPGKLAPVSDRKVCAVYFKESIAQNIVFDNVYASDKLTAVFGGNGDVTMKATNIVRESDMVPVFDPELNVKKMSVSEF